MARVPKPKPQRRKHFLREWRDFRDITQERAMERLGWSQSKISRIENGKTPYSQDDLEAASVAYACSIYELLHVNPLKEGEVVDLLSRWAKADADQQREIADYANYIMNKNKAG